MRFGQEIQEMLWAQLIFAAVLTGGLRKDDRLLMVQCLANFGYSGSPILADINGIPAVVGIFSAFQEEARLTIAASASQFEASIRDLIEAGPTR